MSERGCMNRWMVLFFFCVSTVFRGRERRVLFAIFLAGGGGGGGEFSVDERVCFHRVGC